MKTNKKAILGMLVAMVMSLGVMGGINAKNRELNDTNLQTCWAGMMSYGGGERTPNQDFAVGAAGVVYSGVAGALADAAFGGPAGLIVGGVVGL